MMFYWGMAFILYFLALFCSVKEQKTNVGILGIGKISMFLFVSITIIIGGIRWETGTDWLPYYYFFHENVTWKQFNTHPMNFEYSYSLLNFIVKYLFNSYTILLLINSFIVIFFQYKIIKSIALYPAISYFLFFCDNIGGMFPVRQTIAIAVALTSIPYIHKKNILIFILISILATSFHFSLILWLFAYPLYHIRIHSYIIIILFIVATTIGIFSTNLIILAIEIISDIFNIPVNILTRIWFIWADYSDGSFSLFNVIRSMLKRVLFLTIFLLFRYKLIQKYIYANGFINIYLVSVIIHSFFGFNEALMPIGRVVSVFLFFEVLLLPSIISLCKDNITKHFIICLFLLYGIMKLHSGINMYPELFIPYNSIFN